MVAYVHSFLRFAGEAGVDGYVISRNYLEFLVVGFTVKAITVLRKNERGL